MRLPILTVKRYSIIAFRADIDARPGKENTGLPYSSKIDTIAHTCGHDAHTAILLGTAKYLYSQKSNLKGKYYFIFQPAEETKGGADDIMNSGILTRLKIERIYSLHTASKVPVGTITASSGCFLAGNNFFSIQIEGKGSHSVTPQEGSNVPVLTSKLIEAITAIPSTKMDISSRPCVISATVIECGNANALNVIPNKASIKGTIRAYEQVDSPYQAQPSITDIIIKEINGLCSLQNATAKIEITKAAPPTYNNEIVFNSIIPRLSKVYSGVLITSPNRKMFSEDFSYYTEKFPCLYFGLGISKDNLGQANSHTNEFSVHPEALIFGVELFIDLAMMK